MSLDLSSLAVLIDGDGIPGDELQLAENEYSALANEAHRLRLENERLRDALAIISTTIETLKKS